MICTLLGFRTFFSATKRTQRKIGWLSCSYTRSTWTWLLETRNSLRLTNWLEISLSLVTRDTYLLVLCRSSGWSKSLFSLLCAITTRLADSNREEKPNFVNWSIVFAFHVNASLQHVLDWAAMKIRMCCRCAPQYAKMYALEVLSRDRLCLQQATF